MAVKIIKLIPKTCRCALPNDYQIKDAGWGMGTVVECVDCGTQYKLSNNQRDGTYWEKQSTRLSEDK